MTVEELRQLVQWLEDARIGEFEIEAADSCLRLVLQPNAVPGDAVSLAIDDGEDRGNGVIVTAEVPGIFRIQHPQRATPIVPLGGPVRPGDLVGLIQIGSLYTPVIARTEGILARILTAPETLVGFGTPLAAIASPAT
jgi:biotin carboxyl carrier protein